MQASQASFCWRARFKKGAGLPFLSRRYFGPLPWSPVLQSKMTSGSQTDLITAWLPASARPRSFEGTGRQGSDLLTPGQKPTKVLKLLTPYLENRLSVACVQSFFRAIELFCLN